MILFIAMGAEMPKNEEEAKEKFAEIVRREGLDEQTVENLWEGRPEEFVVNGMTEADIMEVVRRYKEILASREK